MVKLLSILALLLALPLRAEDLYVTPSGAGVEDGSDWDNAWADFSSVVWGTSAGEVGPDDILNVGSGNYSDQCVVGEDGTAGHPITVRAAQDTETGVATFTGSVNMNSHVYVTFDGSYDGATNFNFTGGIAAQNADWCQWHFFTTTNDIVDLRYSGTNIVSNFIIQQTTDVEDTCLVGVASHNSDNYDCTIISNGWFLVHGVPDNGNGQDGCQPGDGYTFTNCILQSLNSAYSGVQHQDLVQAYGVEHIKMLGCEFRDSADSQFDFSKSGNNQMNYLWIVNCTFRRSVSSMGTVGIRIYVDSGGSVTGLTDVRIDNNTFIDESRCASDYGAAIRLQAGDGSTPTSNCSIQNNIFFNCGNTWDCLQIEDYADNWSFSHNLINAGAAGNTDTGTWSQSSGQSGAPTFVSYTAYQLANDLHLAAGDTAARGNGTDLSAYYTTDFDGNTRSTWDIGAYEYQSGAWTPTTPNLTVGTVTFR